MRTDDRVISRTVEVTNRVGFHARPASLLISCARGFSSEISLRKKDATSDLSSILSLLTMGVIAGDEVTVSASGEDAVAAVDAIVELIESNFGEGDQ